MFTSVAPTENPAIPMFEAEAFATIDPLVPPRKSLYGVDTATCTAVCDPPAENTFRPLTTVICPRTAVTLLPLLVLSTPFRRALVVATVWADRRFRTASRAARS